MVLACTKLGIFVLCALILITHKFFFVFISSCDVPETEQEIFEQVLHGDLDFSLDPWPNISESAKDLVKRMLVRDRKRRLTAHEVLCEFVFYDLFIFRYC